MALCDPRESIRRLLTIVTLLIADLCPLTPFLFPLLSGTPDQGGRVGREVGVSPRASWVVVLTHSGTLVGGGDTGGGSLCSGGGSLCSGDGGLLGSGDGGLLGTGDRGSLCSGGGLLGSGDGNSLCSGGGSLGSGDGGSM